MLDSCPVCAFPNTKPYSGQSWTDQGTDYRISVCESCGSAHSTPLPTDQRLQRLYSSSFDYRWYQDHFSAKLMDSKLRLQEYRMLLGKRILDFGGGLGYFSQAAREAGYTSVTYDPFASASPASEEKWDAVVALHILEHTNDLDRICDQFKKLLVPNGQLILAVPNFSGAGYREQGMQWVWAQPPLIHIFHFTAAGLTALLTRHGFKNIRISYHERWDANSYADVMHAERFRRWDSAWGLRVMRSIPGYRKLIAAINSRRRFRSLEKSSATPMESRAELQVCATLDAS